MADDVAEFPLPNDVTAEEREQAKTGIAKYTRVLGDDERAVRFVGRWIGQTGPIWHFQYLRMYQLPTGYLIAGHDLREGIRVVHAASAEELPRSFDHAGVQEFIEDELRFRGILGTEHARTG